MIFTVLSREITESKHIYYHDTAKTALMLENYFNNRIYGLSLTEVEFAKINRQIDEIIDNYSKINPDEDDVKAYISLLWHYYADNKTLGKFLNLTYDDKTRRRLNLCKRTFGNLQYF